MATQLCDTQLCSNKCACWDTCLDDVSLTHDQSQNQIQESDWNPDLVTPLPQYCTCSNSYTSGELIICRDCGYVYHSSDCR